MNKSREKTFKWKGLEVELRSEDTDDWISVCVTSGNSSYGFHRPRGTLLSEWRESFSRAYEYLGKEV